MLVILLFCLALSLLVHVLDLSIVLAWRESVCDAPIVPSTPAPIALAPAPAPIVSPPLAARDPCPSPPPAPSTPIRPTPPEVGPLTPPTSPPTKRIAIKRAPAPLSSKELENRHCEFALAGRFGPAGCRCRRGLVIRRRRLLREGRDELWHSRQELGRCLAELSQSRGLTMARTATCSSGKRRGRSRRGSAWRPTTAPGSSGAKRGGDGRRLRSRRPRSPGASGGTSASPRPSPRRPRSRWSLHPSRSGGPLGSRPCSTCSVTVPVPSSCTGGRDGASESSSASSFALELELSPRLHPPSRTSRLSARPPARCVRDINVGRLLASRYERRREACKASQGVSRLPRLPARPSDL